MKQQVTWTWPSSAYSFEILKVCVIKGCSVKPLLEEKKPYADTCHIEKIKILGDVYAQPSKNPETFNIYENFNYVERSAITFLLNTDMVGTLLLKSSWYTQEYHAVHQLSSDPFVSAQLNPHRSLQ